MRQADTYRVIVTMVLYSLGMALAVSCALLVLADWPAMLKVATLVLLVLLVLGWLLVLVFTAVLRVGNDVCVSMEATVENLVSQHGSGALSSGLVTYYFSDTGGKVQDVLKDVLGVDVDATLSQANSTVHDLQAALSVTPALDAALGTQVAALATAFAGLAAAVAAMEVAISYEAFHPIYLAVKGFLCYTVLNAVGDWWLGFLLLSAFSMVLALAIFRYLDRIADRIQPLGCCHIYTSGRDYSLESNTDVPPSPAKGGEFTSAPSAVFLLRWGMGAERRWHQQQLCCLYVGSRLIWPGGADLRVVVCRKEHPCRPNQVVPTSPTIAAAVQQADVASGAEAAAEIAGEAYRMASQAQSMLNEAARVMASSRQSPAPGSPGAYPSAPSSPGSGAYPSVFVPSSPMYEPLGQPPWKE